MLTPPTTTPLVVILSSARVPCKLFNKQNTNDLLLIRANALQATNIGNAWQCESKSFLPRMYSAFLAPNAGIASSGGGQFGADSYSVSFCVKLTILYKTKTTKIRRTFAKMHITITLWPSIIFILFMFLVRLLSNSCSSSSFHF